MGGGWEGGARSEMEDWETIGEQGHGLMSLGVMRLCDGDSRTSKVHGGHTSQRSQNKDQDFDRGKDE